MADATDLKSVFRLGSEGSSPSSPTIEKDRMSAGYAGFFYCEREENAGGSVRD